MCGQRQASLRCGGKAASTSLAVVLCCRGSSSLALFLCGASSTCTHTYILHDSSVVCFVLKSSNAYDGIFSARRDVLACGSYPLLSRRRGGGVSQWDESCSSEQDCGCRTHEVRHQCDSQVFMYALLLCVCDNHGVVSDAHPKCVYMCVLVD